LENAKFVISLDFELHWGVFDALGESYNQNIQGVQNALPEILKLFKKYDIHATWATVGMLFCKNRADYEKYKPKILPAYKDEVLNPYKMINIGECEDEDKLHYGHSLIKQIIECPHQEISSHSYSHFNALADGQNEEQFENDIKSAIKIAKDKFNIEIKSYIFAKNEINIDYLNILKKYGIKIYRSNPNHNLYNKGQKLNILEKIIRVADSYINITGHYNSLLKKDKICSIQGDRFLRPYKNKLLSKLMIRRIKNEMLEASQNGKVYHLWWHPHNFGINLEENLSNLESLLVYYQELNIKYKMESVCMEELI
jgi:peptidoglycan/xylan/chitin deacetylase (PgdA/CDA1 family)